MNEFDYKLDEWDSVESAIQGILFDRRITLTETRIALIRNVLDQYEATRQE